ncbi:hypothetical protein BU16DRAFT_560021 [Lophium mytilinum]|uniref:Nephrocystin 3-like N-terminal domain-containing protein n=1 Tax=Lophium mytilinum TaxID=390894 RepID=A0A6A6QW54_9PEZI|nr:hypothetical protein BU16DRAFT_560021 [Lophium mytilinum]
MAPPGGSEVRATGFTTLYEPGPGLAKVDIIFVHGLGGHPRTTWATSNKLIGKGKAKQEEKKASKKERKKGISRIGGLFKRSPSRRKDNDAQEISATDKFTDATRHDGSDAGVTVPSDDQEIERKEREHRKAVSTTVFWPKDLLPKVCNNARILTWGYDAQVTKGWWSAGANKNTVYQHGESLVNDLPRHRDLERPIIWIAHSLGGIVVKEALTLSDAADKVDERRLKNIVISTAAVVFMGTPHRGGNSEHVSLGEIARKAASAVGIDTNPALLDALGLKTADLERLQNSFSRLWKSYNFRVKTFRESTGFSKVNIRSANDKVVPDISASLGDPREHAEMLDGNHTEICRMSESDTNWGKVSGELKELCREAEILAAAKARVAPKILDNLDKECLRSLFFPEMNARSNAIAGPANNTTNWIQQDSRFNAWHNWDETAQPNALLWIKGKPGSGKSTVMKSMMKQIVIDDRGRADNSINLVISFFFSAKGVPLQRSSIGLYRSLVYQLVNTNSHIREAFLPLWREKVQDLEYIDGQRVTACQWQETELKSFLEEVYRNRLPDKVRTIIFVDALDECQDAHDTEVISNEARDVVFFLQELSRIARSNGLALDVCLSSRSSFTAGTKNVREIIVDQCNLKDISTYVNARLIAIDSREPDSLWKLGQDIVERSSGIFLWAKLVVDMLLDDADGGRNMAYLRKRLSTLPRNLEQIYKDMLESRRGEDDSQGLTVKFFQWAIFSVKPLQLREWHLIFAFIQFPPPKSLSEWQSSENFIADNDELEKTIRRISRGLVEVTTGQELEMSDEDSTKAGAGSLDLEIGDTRTVQVIHESVREFFRFRGGFAVLDDRFNGPESTAAEAHSTIVECCLNYLNIKEFDDWIEAKRIHDNDSLYAVSLRSRAVGDSTSIFRRASVGSFCSASSQSSDYGRPAKTVPSISHLNLDSEGLTGKDKALQDFLLVQREQYLFAGEAASKTDTCCIQPPDNATYPHIIPSPGTSSESSIINESSSIRSSQELQILGSGARDILALRDYALYEVLTHAKVAQIPDIPPFGVVGRFVNTWERFLLLREDLKRGTSCIQFCLGMNMIPYIIPALELRVEPLINAFCLASDLDNEAAMRCMVRNQWEVYSGLKSTSLGSQWKDLSENIVRRNHTYALTHWRQQCERLLCDEGISNDWILNILEGRGLERRTPLLLVACEHGAVMMIQILLEMGADPTQAREELNVKQTPLDYVCEHHEDFHDTLYELVASLVLHGAVVNSVGRLSNTPLHWLCSAFAAADTFDMSKVVEHLLVNGGDLDAKNESGMTALHLFCSSYKGETTSDFTSVLSRLVEYGGDINTKNNVGYTPLHDLCSRHYFYRQPSRIKELLKLGGDPNMQDPCGRTPLHHSCTSGSSSAAPFVQMLISFGAEINTRDVEGRTALHVYCAAYDITSSVEVVATLLGFGADASVQDCHGHTPLSTIVKTSRRESGYDLCRDIARLLLERMADMDAADHIGKTALHEAVDNHDGLMVDILLEHRANVDVQDECGNTPLHLAATGLTIGGPVDTPRRRCVAALLKAGANSDLKNSKGQAPPADIIAEITAASALQVPKRG